MRFFQVLLIGTEFFFWKKKFEKYLKKNKILKKISKILWNLKFEKQKNGYSKIGKKSDFLSKYEKIFLELN